MYKLIGPVLIKQDLVEAKSNVQKRLEYIQNETERLDKMVCLLYTSPSPRDKRQSRMPSSA